MISQTQIDGEPFVVIDTPRWKAEIILSVGSNMLSLTDKRCGLNILREPPTLDALKEQPEIYGFPVLIPPNCIRKGHFSWRGRDYTLPVNNRFGNHIHGVVLRYPWEFLDSSEEEGKAVVRTRHLYDERNPMFAGFPHKMEVILTYTFLPDRVLQKLSVTNLSGSVMPFAAGFHSSFRFPLGERSPEAYRSSNVRVTTDDFYWEFDKVKYFTLTGKRLRWSGFDNYRQGKIVNRVPVSRQAPLVEDTLDGKPFLGAVLDHPAAGLRVIYEFDRKYRQTALWNWDGDEDFFCAEPMSWMADSPNLGLPDSVTGLYPLEPGELWEAENIIKVEPRN
jgi:aldose 1-epimerase